jgi:hypothetical protein
VGGGKKPRYQYLGETEKAVKVKASFYVEYAPSGGFVSSLVRDKQFDTEMWIPKSQVNKDGSVSEWIYKQKMQEAEDKALSRVLDYQVLDRKLTLSDARGREIKQDNAITKKKFAAGAKKHDALIAEAKKLGVSGVRQNLKSSTLQKMIDDKKNGVIKETSTFIRSSTKVSAGSTVINSRYGTGTIEKVITASSGYVRVRYSDGTVRNEMAFNLKGSDGNYLKKKPSKR